MQRAHQRGFALIELSIVLVIIGLIVGGVLVGRDLIRTATLRSVISDVEKFKTAIYTFRSKYDCLPGDCANATTFFGTTDAQGNAVNNGDGNGTLDCCGPLYEPFWLWQELSLAGLIPGYYNGMQGHSNNANMPSFFQSVPDPAYWGPGGPGTGTANAPASKFANSTYGLLTLGPVASSDTNNGTRYYPGNYGTPTIILGNTTSWSGQWWAPYGAVMSPQDAYAIDSKIDDGVPSSGTVETQPPIAPYSNCNNWNQYPNTGTYNLLYQGAPACNLMFLNVF